MSNLTVGQRIALNSCLHSWPVHLEFDAIIGMLTGETDSGDNIIEPWRWLEQIDSDELAYFIKELAKSIDMALAEVSKR
jgi:hypothetical protein